MDKTFFKKRKFILIASALLFAQESEAHSDLPSLSSSLQQKAIADRSGQEEAYLVDEKKEFTAAKIPEGKWMALGSAGESIFGSIEFKAGSLTWAQGKPWKCVTGYEILSSKKGDTLPPYYKSPRNYETGTTFSMTAIKISNQKCAKLATYLEIARPSNYNALELISYDKNKKIQARLIFAKVDD